MRRLVLLWLFVQLGGAVILAQTPNAKKVAKALFTLKTFKADSTLIGSSNGFFLGNEGVAVSSFAPFRGASSALVIDEQGKEWPVTMMLGANESYDLAKFAVAVRKAQGLSPATRPSAVGDDVWVVQVGTRRSVSANKAAVRRVEQFGRDYAYYSVSGGKAIPSGEAVSDNCPLLDAESMVIGIMQPSASQADTLCYAVDMRLADSMKISGLSINDRGLRQVHIKKALPDQLDQALVTLYMAGSSVDSAEYAVLLDDFIAKFPQALEGYEYRAQLKVGADDFDGARQDMERAIAVASKKDEAHFAYSRIIYQKEVYRRQTPYQPWSLALALDEVRRAYELNPQPIYLNHEARVRYAQGDYAEASGLYERLAATPMRSAALFYEASRCREQLRDTLGQLALLDSAVSQFTRPYIQEAAPYLLARAQVRMLLGRARDAVTDLNDYESLLKSRLTPNFYYMRYQAEVGGRLFQQALNDIDKAISMDPASVLYLAEKASLQVRVALYDDAIETARRCIDVAPDHSDGYLFLGLSLCLKGDKAEGVRHLQKARELGDSQADELIAKYAQ